MNFSFLHHTQFLNLVKALKKFSPTLIKQNNQKQNQKNLKKVWEFGKALKELKQKTNYGEKDAMLKVLSQKTKISRTDLFTLINLYLCFPRGLPKINQGQFLSWTHFRLVLPIQDSQERLYYLHYAAREGLSTRYLELAIKSDLYLSETMAGSDHPHGLLTSNPSVIYTYKTKVLKVKDGDTLRLSSDKGFYARQEYNGRLRGINCSELSGPNSELAIKAKAHVERVLAPCEFVLITTYKPDSFGRTLVDLRYHPLWQDPSKIYHQGFFLNQELLDLGLAKLAPF